MMHRPSLPLLLSVATAASLAVACSSGPDTSRLTGEGEPGGPAATSPASGGGTGGLPAEAPMSDAERAKVTLLREAIGRGLGLGKETLGEAVNLELGQLGVTKRFTGTEKSGKAYFAPKSDGVCPFLSPAPSGESIDCRAVVTRATISAYGRASAIRAANPLDDRFQSIRAEGEFHFGEGFASGVDNEATAALYGLREQRLCDQSPKPAESAFEAGVERGRQLYVAEVNKRLKETGSNMSYPDRIQQITVCAANTSLLEPARARARSGADAWAKENPLCAGYRPGTQADIAAVEAAEKQFAAGATQGVNTEHSLALERIFRVVQCNTGDPLVLDLAGDGVSIVPLVESRARFDLYGAGDAVRVAWVRGDDGLLALDRNGNGAIDDGRELFGDATAGDGFASLAAYDRPALGGDGDGRITPRDAVFGALVVWLDADGDGVSVPAELRSLRQVGVASIDLGARRTGEATVRHVSTFERAGWAAASTGSPRGQIVDVWLSHGRPRVF